MKETIGVKGDSNDRKKIIITKKQKKKLKRYYESIRNKRLKELEDKVRKTQIINFLTAVPLVISANVVKTFFNNCKSINNKEVKKDLDIEVKKIKINENIKQDKVKEKLNIDNKVEINEDEVKEKINISEKQNEKKEEKYQKKEIPIVIIPFENIIKSSEKKVQSNQEEIINKEIDKKIIEKYTDELKSIRTELKEIAYSSKSSDKEYDKYKKDAEDLLKKLNIVIKRLDELGNKIKSSNLGDEDYYYDMALKYIDEFSNNIIVDGIKNSDLYIEIADKLKIIDYKKEQLRKNVLEKKMNVDISNEIEKEELLEEDLYEEFENDVENLQNLQDEIIIQLEENEPKKENKENKNDEAEKQKETLEVSNALEIALLKAKSLNKYCEALLATINKKSMKMPGVRSTKKVAITTLIAAYFMNKVLKNKFRLRKRKKVLKKDYSKHIESSLLDIENVISLIKEASSKIDSLIKDITSKYSEYLYLKEFQDLLNNLEEVRSNIKEKEYEIENIKSREMDSLNNQKVK